MDPYEVGLFRRCPACGRPVVDADKLNRAIDEGWAEFTGTDDISCSCCERPWYACPCTPPEEGDCRAIRRLAGDGHIPESNGSH